MTGGLGSSSSSTHTDAATDAHSWGRIEIDARAPLLDVPEVDFDQKGLRMVRLYIYIYGDVYFVILPKTPPIPMKK